MPIRFTKARPTGQLIGARQGLSIVAADTTLTTTDSGKVVVVNAAASKTITLPAASAGAGMRFTVTEQVASTSGSGHLVHPAGTDQVRGNGFTAANSKGAVCTQATSRVGDSITLVSDGVSAWYIESVTGTWAREA